MTGSQMMMMSATSEAAPVVDPLSINLSSTIASGSARSSIITSNIIDSTPSGGTPPYVTYSWAVTTSDGIVAVSPSSPSTAFRKNNAVTPTNDIANVYTGTAKLTVTDSAAGTKVSQTVNITLTRPPDRDIGGGGFQ